MIPNFDERGLLPLGLHVASLSEIRDTLGFTSRRRQLIEGLEEYIHIWDRSGFLEYCIIDGSFATSKPDPGDIDLILVPRRDALPSSAFRELATSHSYDRDFTKTEYGCEGFFVTGSEDLDGWLEFFRRDRQGNVRGLLQLRLPLR